MKLLVLDVEGTLFATKFRLPGTSIASTVWQGLAHALGPDAEAEEVASHKRWERGEYHSYIDWMKDTIRIHQKFNLSKDQFNKVITAAEYNPGVEEALRQIDRCRFEPVMITGGFRELATRPQKDFRIAHAFAACEYDFDELGRLSGFNLLPCDFEGKMDFILLMLREYGLSEDDWVFVGDGKNDVPIASRCPLSIGYNPHPELANVVTHVITDFRELLEILNQAESTTLSEVDWNRLFRYAWQGRENAFLIDDTKVGAAVVTPNGRIFQGCNVEHHFRSHDIHAEVNAISTMVGSGERKCVAIAIAAERVRFTPCGACMDWIMQFGGIDCLVGFQSAPNGEYTIHRAGDLMPHYPK